MKQYALFAVQAINDPKPQECPAIIFDPNPAVALAKGITALSDGGFADIWFNSRPSFNTMRPYGVTATKKGKSYWFEVCYKKVPKCTE